MEFKDITFVIPTINKEVKTLESIPKECQVRIQREKTRGEARNCGVLSSTTDYIAFCDSDIKFSQLFLEYIMSITNDRTIVGLQAFYPSPFLLSRFMFFKKSIWDDVGELMPVQHGEETEWLLRAIEKDYKIIGVPRESIYHYPHKKSEQKKEVNNLLWLLRLHPMFPIRVLRSVIFKMKESSYEDDVSLRFR